MFTPCNACPVEFPDSSGTPLACPGATIREHDPVLEKTIPSSAINPILVYQVWARGIQQGGPISLGPAPWNLYPARNINTNGHIEGECFNLLTPDGTIPLGICNSNMRFFPKAPPTQC